MNLKKTGLVILGSLISGIGIAITIAVDLGSDPMTLFWIGIADTLHITVGQANLLVCAVILAVIFFVDRKQIHVGSILNPIVIALVTDSLAFLDFHGLPMMGRILMMIIGFAILAFGVAFYALADYGKGAYEALVFTLSKKLDKPVGPIRTTADILFALLGVLLGAHFALGTLLAILCMGLMIQICLKCLNKFFSDLVFQS
ncbi:MAG TPA: hypothetical protein H9886_01195 [Candidatus Faecalicoccus intestinipullorum]|nr:hypothetical protein [Candidatus Faecalicoccus intestinipullorum]